MKLGSRAARVGFDWTDLDGVIHKIEEEVRELRAALAGNDADAVRAEMGDLLFSLAQSARHLGMDAEGALREANAKFERRFRHMEATLAAQGRDAAQVGAEELESLWLQATRELG